jgi:hypothetical protein
MLISRRFGDLDVTARLDGHRYVVDGPVTGPAAADAAPAPETGATDEAPKDVPAHLRSTLDALKGTPRGLTPAGVQQTTAAASATVWRRLKGLEALGLAKAEGEGTSGSPQVWRAVEPEAKAAPPTADPEYVRYLNSAAWAAKRAEVLARAAGSCEGCGEAVEGAETEVHHLTYERIGRELPEDLVALCPGCHRRKHKSK